MKKIIYFIITMILIPFSFSACNSENPEKEALESKNWIITETTTIDMDGKISVKDIDYMLSFSDGKYTLYIGRDNPAPFTSGKYELSGKTLTFDKSSDDQRIVEIEFNEDYTILTMNPGFFKDNTEPQNWMAIEKNASPEVDDEHASEVTMTDNSHMTISELFKDGTPIEDATFEHPEAGTVILDSYFIKKSDESSPGRGTDIIYIKMNKSFINFAQNLRLYQNGKTLIYYIDFDLTYINREGDDFISYMLRDTETDVEIVCVDSEENIVGTYVLDITK